jgi:hypothetical protein
MKTTSTMATPAIDKTTELTEHVLPSLPEDVTPTWLALVLSQEVKTLEITKVVHGTASKVFATITTGDDDASDASRPSFLCIKGGFDPRIKAQYPWIVNMHFREADFFSRVAPKLAHISLPKAYWAGHDGTSQGIVIMDDLATQGCQFGDPARSWPVRQVLAGVEQLAALHAGTWGARGEDYPWLTAHCKHPTHLLGYKTPGAGSWWQG